jgi:DNA-directed RNA polymerase subunit RPC12/RpoP
MSGDNEVCSKCGSIYNMSYTRTIMRDKDSIDCDVCGNRLFSWNEAKIWSSKLIERHEKHLEKPSE